MAKGRKVQGGRILSQGTVNADSVSEFISKCIGDVIPTASIRTFPNQKQWIDGSISAKLKARTTAFNQGKVTGNTNSLAIPSARQSNKLSVSIE